MSSPALPAPESLRHNLACTGCGYNLRGLARDGACPECGRAILLSLDGYFLDHANPTWLATLFRGLAIIALSYMFWIASSLAMMAIATIWSFPVVPALILAWALTAVMRCFGVWRATVPEPAVAVWPRERWGRWTARVGMTAAALLLLALTLSNGVLYPLPGRSFNEFLPAGAVACEEVGMAGFWFLSAGLAFRARAPMVAEFARIAAWSAIAGLVCLFLCIVPDAIFGMPSCFSTIGACGLVPVAITCVALSAVLSAVLGRQVRVAARLSRQHQPPPGA